MDQPLDQLVVFISYSHDDGRSFALKLRDWLGRISPPAAPWIDLDHIGEPGEKLQRQIKGCDVFLFVMTRNSPHRRWCLDEISLALDVEKPVIPLRFHNDAELPLLLRMQYCIDFTKNTKRAWGDLRRALNSFSAPEAKVESINQKISALERGEPHASGTELRGIENELAALRQQRQELQRRITDPHGARHEAVEEISRGQEKDRAGEPDPVGLPGMRCVHEPPAPFPGKFRDRTAVIANLENYLRDQAIRLVAVVGRNGIGKTAMIRQLRHSLWAHRRRFPVGAFVYLAYYSLLSIRPAALLDGLRHAVADPATAARLSERLNDPALTLRDKLDEVMEELTGTTVIVLDDAEALLDTHGHIRDPELGELVGALLSRSDSKVKLIFVTCDVPRQLLVDYPVRAKRFELDGGLPAPDARAFLRELDDDGTLGLKSAPEEHLNRAYQLTSGHPRALEELYVILRNELGTSSLVGLLDEIEQLPSNSDSAIMNYLMGRSFGRLDPVERRLIQVLAAYGRPVRSSAVTYVLKWYLTGYMSEEALRRLADKRLVRHDGERFFLPPSPDGEWVLAGIPVGTPGDYDCDRPPFTRLALWHYAAEYFVGARQTRVLCVDDLIAQLSEIDLRILAGEYRAAFELMSTIDSDYLDRWGHSDAIAEPREKLKGNLGDQYLEARNLTRLAAARQQQDDQQQAIDVLTEVLDIAKQLPDVVEIRIRINLGSAYRDDGQVSEAQAYYEQALSALKKHRDPLLEAQASEGLCLCLAGTGQFERALTYLDAALGLMQAQQGTEARSFESELLLNRGWINAQLGRSETALEALRRGDELACKLGKQLLQGYFLGGQAEVRIDDGLWETAIELAKRAVGIGAQAHDVRLSLAANQTLAVALLCGGDIGGAYAAADHAARYRRSPKVFAALAVQGLAAFRKGDLEKARLAFHEACTRAQKLREQDGRNFRALDILGLALCGLAICGDHEQLEPAVSAYRAAREVTCGQGAVRRSLLLLDKLTEGWDPATCAEVRRAASAS